MANLQEIKATVTARLAYEEDFTYDKKKEEMAQLIRSDIAPRVLKILGGESAKVAIDSDDDISIQIKDIGQLYVMSRSLLCSASNITLSLISESPLVRSLPSAMVELHRLRSQYLKPISYGARVFATFWYPSAPSIDNLRSQFFSPFRQFSKGNITNLSSNLTSVTQLFRDTLDLESKAEQVTVRVMRDADVAEFADFADFWDKARIGEVVAKLSPLFEPLDRTEEQASLSKMLGALPARK